MPPHAGASAAAARTHEIHKPSQRRFTPTGLRWRVMSAKRGTTLLAPPCLIAVIFSDARLATARTGLSVKCAYRSVVQD